MTAHEWWAELVHFLTCKKSIHLFFDLYSMDLCLTKCNNCFLSSFMILTPQQAALAPLIQEHLASKDPRALIIEGVSGVGKSSLIRRILQETGQNAVFIPAGTSSRQGREAPDVQVAVMDYTRPERVLDFRRALEDRIQMVLLAHPRLTSAEGLVRVNHVHDLEKIGLPTLLHRLPPMEDSEARAFAEELSVTTPTPDRLTLIERYGLGVSAQVQHLMGDPDLNEERARSLALAHLHRILLQAHQYHHSPLPERVVNLLGRDLSDHELGLELQANRHFSLEGALAKVDPSQPYILPRYKETLELYKQIFETQRCINVGIFAPEAGPDLLEKLGFMQGEFVPGGRLLGFCSYIRKAGLMTQKAASPYLEERGDGNPDRFEEWLRGEIEEYIPRAGEYALYAVADGHGASRFLDHPLFPYAIETLLQAKGVPYLAEYVLGQGEVVRHQVSESGVKVLANR